MREKSITVLSHYGRYIAVLLLFFRAVMFSIRKIIQHGKAALTVEWTVGPARYVVEQIKECVSWLQLREMETTYCHFSVHLVQNEPY